MSAERNIRAKVIDSLSPELDKIRDTDLREKVVSAWTLALSKSSFSSIEDIPGSGVPGSPKLRKGTQADHIRGVSRLSCALARELEDMAGIEIDYDLLVAAALCHDAGKPIEFDPERQERWTSDPAKSGKPAARHPAYGVWATMSADLPDVVVNAAAGHSGEGELLERSLITEIVHHADKAYWHILAKAGALESNA